MLKSKRFNGSMAAVVVLAVLLAVAIASGATLAWFASQDSASAQFALGDSVVVAVADEDSAVASDLDIVIPAEYLVPGMQIFPSIYADIEESSTSALLRASIEVTAAWGGGEEPTEVPALWTYETDHWVYNVGEVDEINVPTTVANTPVALNTWIIETYLKESFTAKANGWYYNSGDDYYYFVGNGASYSMYMTAVGALSGDSYTNATYATAGTLLANPFAGDETSATDLATAFFDSSADQALVGTSQVASIVTLATDENSDPISTYSTPAYGTYAHVPFLVRPVTIPISWTNIVANAGVTLNIEFQAVQDYLVDPATANSDSVTTLLTTLANAQPVFTSAFGA